MMRRALRACLLCAALTLPAPLVAAPLTLTCPDGPAAAAASGWTKLVRTPATSDAAWSIFDGHPDELAQLAPDRDTGRSQVFGLDPRSDIWIRCGAGRPVAIYERKLPPGLRTCEVRYAGTGARPQFERTMNCR